MLEYEEYNVISYKQRKNGEYILFVEMEDYANDLFLKQEIKMCYFVCVSSTKHFKIDNVLECVFDKTRLTNDKNKLLKDYQETKILFDSMI